MAYGSGKVVGPEAQPGVNNSLRNQYRLYNSAVSQQGQDYGDIMQGYREMLNRIRGGGGTYTPQTSQYSQSTDLTDAIAKQKELSETGGYSGSDIANLRERGISPIRSIYAGAQRDMDRRRSLQGGYSPSYNASKLKGAREMSDLIAGQMTNVNAGIAQNVAQNKLTATPAYAATTSGQSNLANQMGMENANMVNEANRFNITNRGEQEGRALQGMTSLYGTTPALSSLFGNQAMSLSELQNRIMQQGNQNGLQMVGQLMTGLR